MGAKYASTRVNTNGKADFKYGRFDARAKLPNTLGIWPAIWMYLSAKAAEVSTIRDAGSDTRGTHLA